MSVEVGAAISVKDTTIVHAAWQHTSILLQALSVCIKVCVRARTCVRACVRARVRLRCACAGAGLEANCKDDIHLAR